MEQRLASDSDVICQWINKQSNKEAFISMLTKGPPMIQVLCGVPKRVDRDH